MIDLLRANGPFYKANLHCHTTLSDGRMTAAQVKDWYRAHGYSIVAFTDHSKYVFHGELESDDFLPVPGVEAAFICRDANHPSLKYRLCHLTFVARDPATAVYVPEEPVYDPGVINRYIARMKRGGWLCTLNHPGWSLQSTEEILSLTGFEGFEVYNHTSHALDNNGDGQVHYAQFLNSGRRAWAVATDDNHGGFDPDGSIGAEDDTLGGFVMISMPELSYAAFADSFEHGRFYASTGPIIHRLAIDEEKDSIVLDCTPVKRVLVKGVHTRRAFRMVARGDDITHAEIPLAEIRAREPFFRLELATASMQRAYSQPWWFEDGR